ncbi:TM2 domain-containing protein 3 isoform 1-T1 [Glossophaga mutica]
MAAAAAAGPLGAVARLCRVVLFLSQFCILSGGESTDIPPYVMKCPSNGLCGRLPADCIECKTNSSCVYGKPAAFDCTVKPSVTCVDQDFRSQKNFVLNMTCRFCWQLPETEYECSNSTTCMTVSCPRQRYAANCTVRDHVHCLGNRTFPKMLYCNWTGGYKWSTALALRTRSFPAWTAEPKLEHRTSTHPSTFSSYRATHADAGAERTPSFIFRDCSAGEGRSSPWVQIASSVLPSQMGCNLYRQSRWPEAAATRPLSRRRVSTGPRGWRRLCSLPTPQQGACQSQRPSLLSRRSLRAAVLPFGGLHTSASPHGPGSPASWLSLPATLGIPVRQRA